MKKCGLGFRCLLVVPLIFLLLSGASGNALAAAQSAGSSAYGGNVDLTLLPFIGGPVDIDLGPLPLTNGSAPPGTSYNQSNNLASINLNPLGIGQILKTGVLNVSASGNLASETSSAVSEVLNPAVSVVGLLQLLGLKADVIKSAASITGCDGTSFVGTTTITNGQLGGLLTAPITILPNPAPNTVLLNLLGVKIVLNEQIIVNTATSKSLTVNAIHVYLNALHLLSGLIDLGILSGDIIVAQSHAEMTCGTPVPASANLSITKTAAPDPVTVGSNLMYHITASNSGPNSATGVVVTDTLPASVTYVSATPSQGTCNKSGNVVTCNLGTINAAQTATVDIVVKPTVKGQIINSASVSSSVSDPDTQNNTTTISTTVSTAATGADLQIHKTANPSPVDVGDTLTYTITVLNQGPNSAKNVVVKDALPSGVDFVSAVPTQGSCNKSGNVVTCNLGTVNASQIATVVIKVIPTEQGILENTAKVKSGVSDPDQSDNQTTISTECGPTGAPGSSVDVPTLSEWGMIILSSLLALAATLYLKRKKHN